MAIDLYLKGSARGTADTAYAKAVNRGAKRLDFTKRFFAALYADCRIQGLDADVLSAQWSLETGDGTSLYWTRDGNPGGIGAFPDGTNIGATFTPETAARCLVTHNLCYMGIDPGPEWRKTDPRWQAVLDKGWYGDVWTVRDYTGGRWATDDAYAQKWIDRYVAYWGQPNQDVPGKEPPTMAEYPVTVPGAPGGPIVFSFPVRLQIVPAWRTNNRPGILARSPRVAVQHETANPNTYAAAEASYLFNGAGGRQASWHMTADDTEVVLSIPVNEVTWQAGDGAGPGNMNGLSCELSVHTAIVNNPTRLAKARKNAAEAMGRIGARIGAPPPAKRHKDFMLKDCPRWLNANPAAWNQYVDHYTFFYNDERRRMGGGGTVVPTFKLRDILRVTERLNFRDGFGINARILQVFEPGAELVITGGPQTADGYKWWNVSTRDNAGSGWVAEGASGVVWLEKIGELPAPKPEPVYAKPVVIQALFDTDLKKYDTAPGIVTVVDGNDVETDFVFVADVIEFKKTTPALAWADAKNAPSVRADFAEGERVVAPWLVEAADGEWYYILEPEDGWARVPYGNTVRVSDAPLLGDDME